MGRMKDLWIQMHEDEQGVRIAEVLGISYLDLDRLDYEITENKNKDGLVYGYQIKFSKDSPKDVLDQIKRLEGRTVNLEDWELQIDHNDDYYDDRYDAILSNKNFYDTFLSEIENIKLEAILHKQIFISVFGILETFLADTFINLTTENDDYLRNFVKTHPYFKEAKFNLGDIFDKYEAIKDIAKSVMLNTIYHDLPKVKLMYSMTFDIIFPDFTDLIKLVSTRHDLVHRNGKTKEGKLIIIDLSIIKNLIDVVSAFVKDIAIKLHLHQESFEWQVD